MYSIRNIIFIILLLKNVTFNNNLNLIIAFILILKFILNYLQHLMLLELFK